jgi:ABC-type nitrate/sulfonate/bicarbonate transport system permease component
MALHYVFIGVYLAAILGIILAVVYVSYPKGGFFHHRRRH